MSNQEDRKGKATETQAISRLEKAVKAAVVSITELEAQLEEAREKGEEASELLRRFTGGEEDPARLMSRLGALENENRVLKDRLQQGLEGVDRLLARIRFLEEQA